MKRSEYSRKHAEDIAYAKALHGSQLKKGLWSNLRSKNNDVYSVTSNTYFSMWGKDANNDTEENEKDRASRYSTLVNAYYNLATDFYEYGWGKSFHFCRFYPGEEFHLAMKRHEYFLALKLDIQPGMKVLDVGCGVGGPARAIAHLTGASIIGLNNNAYQLEKARDYAVQEDLSKQLEFIKGDFMAIPFDDNTFDRIYAVEATCHAPTFEGVYAEIYRVLKPGGKFGCYEWCMTENYDPTNQKHKEIAHGIALGNSLPDVRSIADSLEALKNVGFQIELQMDLANQGDRITWYYPLEGDLRQCQTLRDVLTTLVMTKWGRFTTTNICRVLEKIGLAPKGTVQTQEVLEVAGDSVVAGGREGIFTPMFFFVAVKPETAATNA
ncbi:sterol 24-C-methyltransferase [Mycotypha africana]|uniref:sterol 24-C-methyltransferase n=1 Tax=Mycotypha africana TaxID=64632 RepID=UPI0023000FDE|nr:sterol 24-C-methyltransferase [Mycotypha africana]KAI8971521.1 sterol 24-C-methyltransferase [Mycotypha africana]